MKVYLAGGMKGTWQDDVIAACPGLEFFDPRTHRREYAVEYTAWDFAHLMQADIVFAYMEDSNPGGQGLCAEVGFARARGKTVIFVNEVQGDRRRYFQIIEMLSGVTYFKLDQAIDFLQSFQSM